MIGRIEPRGPDLRFKALAKTGNNRNSKLLSQFIRYPLHIIADDPGGAGSGDEYRVRLGAFIGQSDRSLQFTASAEHGIHLFKIRIEISADNRRKITLHLSDTVDKIIAEEIPGAAYRRMVYHRSIRNHRQLAKSIARAAAHALAERAGTIL
ncbi:hypothetical protein D3C72_1892040 [compost metagenome]